MRRISEAYRIQLIACAWKNIGYSEVSEKEVIMEKINTISIDCKIFKIFQNIRQGLFSSNPFYWQIYFIFSFTLFILLLELTSDDFWSSKFSRGDLLTEFSLSFLIKFWVNRWTLFLLMIYFRVFHFLFLTPLLPSIAFSKPERGSREILRGLTCASWLI